MASHKPIDTLIRKTNLNVRIGSKIKGIPPGKVRPRCPTNQITHCRARVLPQSTLLLAPKVSTNRAKKQTTEIGEPFLLMHGTRPGSIENITITQPSGKPLTRLMKPNQNVKSITSVVVILLSILTLPQKKGRLRRTRPKHK